MRGETKERWRELCERAVVEQDPERFLATIQELLEALERNEEKERQRNRNSANNASERKSCTVKLPRALSSSLRLGWFPTLRLSGPFSSAVEFGSASGVPRGRDKSHNARAAVRCAGA